MGYFPVRRAARLGVHMGAA